MFMNTRTFSPAKEEMRELLLNDQWPRLSNNVSERLDVLLTAFSKDILVQQLFRIGLYLIKHSTLDLLQPFSGVSLCLALLTI